MLVFSVFTIIENKLNFSLHIVKLIGSNLSEYAQFNLTSLAEFQTLELAKSDFDPIQFLQLFLILQK